MLNVAAVDRIKKELRYLSQDQTTKQYSGNLEPCSDDNFAVLQGFILGPPDTVYEGGTFKVEVTFPQYYPFDPPKVKFLTKIWHPNISSLTGALCPLGWVPAIIINSLIGSLQSLLAFPELNEPLDPLAAAQYLNHPEIFNATAEHWTAVYAGGPKRNKAYEKMVKYLVNMGVDSEMAIEILTHKNWKFPLIQENLLNSKISSTSI